MRRIRVKSTLVKGGAVVVSVTVAIACVEIILRAFWPQQTGPVQFAYDPIRGAVPVPYQKARRILPGVYDYTYSNNSLGLRGSREYGQKTRPHRLLMLGDSFTYGIGVDDDQTFAFLLEQRTEDTEVINGGNGGTGTDYALRFFETLGKDLHPDVVALCFFRNDFLDNERWVYYEVDHEALKARDLSRGVSARKAFLNTSPYNWLIVHSHFANLVKQVFVRYSSRSDRGVTSDKLDVRDGFSNSGNQRLTERYLGELVNSVRQINARFIVFYVPSSEEVSRKRAGKPESPDEMTVRNIANNHQINFASLTGPMAASTLNIDSLYYAEGHWMPAAHQIAAEVMARALKSEVARAIQPDASR